MRFRNFALLLLAFGCGSLLAKPAIAGCMRCTPPLEGVELLATMETAGRELVRYEANYRRKLGAEALQRRADQLADLTGRRMEGWEAGPRGEDRLTLRDPKDPSASLELDSRSGNFFWNAGLARYRKEEETTGLPKDGEARDLVFRQLAKIKLVPNRDEIGSMHEGGLNMAVAQPDGSTKIYRKLVSLRIGRRLAGLPVMGESRIVAHLGEDGRLAGLVYQWPDVGRPQPLAPEELRSAAELQADAEATLTDGAVGAERIVVVRAELVMYDDDRGVFEPTYHVEARLHYSRPTAAGGDQKDARYDVPFDFFVPVAKRPLAFLPSMEVAPVAPTDGRRAKPVVREDE
jgi:hypothetical protein